MDKKNLRAIEFAEHYGSVKIEQVAIFNQTTATDDDVRNALDVPSSHHENVIIISKQQYENVFGPLPTSDEDNTNEGVNLQ